MFAHLKRNYAPSTDDKAEVYYELIMKYINKNKLDIEKELERKQKCFLWDILESNCGKDYQLLMFPYEDNPKLWDTISTNLCKTLGLNISISLIFDYDLDKSGETRLANVLLSF